MRELVKSAIGEIGLNRKSKGSRNERRARDILKDLGHTLVVKSGASLGLFDLVALSGEYDYVLLVQVWSHRKPGCAELEILVVAL